MDHASDEIPDLVDDDDDSTDDVEILDNKKPDDELSNEADDEFVMKQLEKLIIQAQEERKQFEAYWKRRHQEDKDLWRDKDFANAIYKMCRAGYKGKHGNFDVPEQIMQQMDALYMQVTVGDYDGNKRLNCANEWKKLKAVSPCYFANEDIRIRKSISGM
ncbi:TAP42 [Dirofilaria immitis]|nr:TAP42 [Dirofilaria immitis]